MSEPASGVNGPLREARERLGRTQEEIVSDLNAVAHRMHGEGRLKRPLMLSDRQYRRWERARPPMPRRDSRAVLEEFFGRPLRSLGFVPPPAGPENATPAAPPPAMAGAAPHEEGDPTDRRSALALLGGAVLIPLVNPDTARADDVRAYTVGLTSGGVDPARIEDLELAVHRLGAAYPNHAPRDLWSVAASQRQAAASLLEQRPTPRQGRELAHQAGMLSVVLAWIAHDLGRKDLVAVLCEDAWQHGEQAGSPEVCAWSEDVRCTDALYDQRPWDALAAANRGVAIAPGKSKAAIRLSAQLARAYAYVGNKSAFLAAAAEADRFREHIPPHGAGLFAVDAVRLISYNASSYGRLGDHNRAALAAAEAIGQYEAVPSALQAPTRLAIAQLDLAFAHAELGNVDGAIEVAQYALTSSRLVQSIRGRAHRLGRTLALNHPELPQARSFSEETRALAA
ncbi:hypothetical protein N0X72_01075 [Streptomyces carpaticus]|uniref:hypothetical protein n=1 Tax=Streptomyces carpaticus TaxID=285558 RepID=UPI00220388D7|nr:hypothetical protein N0X72_01075 [Streptomyces carpaticus]